VEDYFLLGNTKEAIIENLQGRDKLKKALNDPIVKELIRIYKVNVDKITIAHYGTNPMGRASSLMEKTLSGGVSSNEILILVNANITTEQMVKELEVEIPKHARAVEKAAKALDERIKHDQEYKRP
jgi:hypothetical protein